MNAFVVVLLVAVASSTDAQSNFQCPHDFGFYPHDVACDKYWACDAGVGTLKTCGNGLAFDDSDAESLTENCDYYHNVDCSTRPERQPAIPSPNCAYQYGIFTDSADCTVFWSCWGGEASRYQCGPGLAYSIKSRVCTWIDKVPECKEQRAAFNAEFACPASGALVALSSFTRHAHPDDCRQYYVCLDGVPREYGCPIGTVFQIGNDEGSGQCAEPELVPGCQDYYGELDLGSLRKSQLLLGSLGLGTGSQRKPQQTQSRQVQIQQQQQVAPLAASAPSRPSPNSSRARPQQVVLPQEVVLEEDLPLN